MTGLERRQFLEGMEEDHIVGRNLKQELESLLLMIPGCHTIHVREGGGPEDLLASLALSIRHMAKELE